MNYQTIRKLGQSAGNEAEVNHLTLDDRRQRLIRRIQLLKREAKELHDAIVDALTFKQYQKWDKRPEAINKVTRNPVIIARANRITAIWNEIQGLGLEYKEVLRQSDARPSLRLVESKAYTWYELRLMKINKQANKYKTF